MNPVMPPNICLVQGKKNNKNKKRCIIHKQKPLCIHCFSSLMFINCQIRIPSIDVCCPNLADQHKAVIDKHKHVFFTFILPPAPAPLFPNFIQQYVLLPTWRSKRLRGRYISFEQTEVLPFVSNEYWPMAWATCYSMFAYIINLTVDIISHFCGKSKLGMKAVIFGNKLSLCWRWTNKLGHLLHHNRNGHND